MTRQAMFRDDGTITDVPTKLTENPQLEKQLDLLQYPVDTANLARLQRPLVNPHATALAQDKQLRAQQRHDRNPSTSKANDYIKRIRNQRKKLYARAYLGYLLRKRSEPDHNGYALSYMAGQSVRMELGRLIS